MILFFKRVFKSSDNFPRNGKTMTKCFFSAVNVTGFSVSLLLRKFLMLDIMCIVVHETRLEK